MLRRPLALLSASVGLLFAVGLAGGCGKQTEGERCNTANGSDDCESGLECKNVSGVGTSICCPSDPQSATTTECKGEVVVSDAASDSATADETGDASGDSSADASDGAPAGFGRACKYNSECREFDGGVDDADAHISISEPSLSCISGHCLYQCITSDDCQSGQVCVSPGMCVVAGADTGVADTGAADTGSSEDSSTDASSADAADATADSSTDGG